MKIVTTLALLLVLVACGESSGGRAVTGGLLGAGTGAAVSGIAGGSLVRVPWSLVALALQVGR